MLTILLADDNRDLRENLNNFLIGEGFKVFLAENGLTAYQIAVEHLPALIISDIHMPVMDGFELTEKLKENPLTSSIPVIYITADPMKKEELPGKCLIKPFNLNELHELITESLNRIENIN